MKTHCELISDTADLHDLTLESLTESSMAAMADLLDRLEAKLISIGAMRATPA